MDIQDRIAVVTGGGSGIGEALCKEFAQSGARHVVVVDLNAEEARRVAAEIESGPHRCGATAVAIDVSDEPAVANLVERTEQSVGPIDVFVSNAGYVTVAGLEDSNDSIQRMWEVHVLSHIYAARAVVPSMAARGEGYLLHTASAAGLLSQIGSLAYTITKHAAVSLAEWLAITHHHQGIGVSVLCPQAVRTNIVANSPDEKLASGSLDDFGVASADGIVESRATARMCMDAIEEERFLVLPHPEVAEYMKVKAADTDRWLGAMRKFQDRLYGDNPLPGDEIISR